MIIIGLTERQTDCLIGEAIHDAQRLLPADATDEDKVADLAAILIHFHLGTDIRWMPSTALH